MDKFSTVFITLQNFPLCHYVTKHPYLPVSSPDYSLQKVLKLISAS